MGFAYLFIPFVLLAMLAMFFYGLSLVGLVIFAILAVVFRKKKERFNLFTALAFICLVPSAGVGQNMMRDFMGGGRFLLFSLLTAVLFLILAVNFRKAKRLCALCAAAAVMNFLPVANAAQGIMNSFLNNAAADIMDNVSDGRLCISSQAGFESAVNNGDMPTAAGAFIGR